MTDPFGASSVALEARAWNQILLSIVASEDKQLDLCKLPFTEDEMRTVVTVAQQMIALGWLRPVEDTSKVTAGPRFQEVASSQ